MQKTGQIAPGSPVAADLERGALALKAGRLVDAEAAYRRVLAKAGDQPPALEGLARTVMAAGRPAEAAALLERLTRLVPRHAGVLAMLGAAHARAGTLDRAEAAFCRALKLDPGSMPARRGLADCLDRMERPAEAATLWAALAEAAPDDAQLQRRAAGALLRIRRLSEGLALTERWAARMPNDVDALVLMATFLRDAERGAEAEAALEKAIALRPDDSRLMANMANLHQAAGDRATAEHWYRRALDADPRFTEAWRSLAMQRSFTDPDDADLVTMERLVRDPGRDDPGLDDPGLDDPELDDRGRMHLWFGIGKAREDLKAFPEALDAYIEANALRWAASTYDPATMDRFIDRVIDVFDTETTARVGGLGVDDATPIFILGMPRSGTTLVEQILASHSAVDAGGELYDLYATVREADAAYGDPFPGWMDGLDAEAARHWAGSYLDRVAPRHAPGRRLTDKMPANFQFIGLIHALFPGAAIVHCRRNPVDTCLSCFSKLFTSGQDFTYDMAALGRYYLGYQRMMAHWDAVLPEGRVLTVDYESMVAEPEAQTRRLLDHCGLPFEEACLSFHETKRGVRTASAHQVRKPIYGSSVEKWRRYGPRIQPLLDALGYRAE